MSLKIVPPHSAKVGEWLLKEDGNGYRLRRGRGSVYLYEGLLKFYEE